MTIEEMNVPWDQELPNATLNDFSAAVREAVKSYVQDPGKGVPFKIDGTYTDFKMVDMRYDTN